MSIPPLLEPLLSPLEPGVAGEVPQIAELMPWLIRLVGYQTDVWPTAHGMREGANPSILTCALGLGDLTDWIQHLYTSGHDTLALQINQTLTHHLTPDPVMQWQHHRLDLSQPRIMGILNCTPDSFSNDGKENVDAAIKQGVRMAEEGADILDIGGESTRPGATPVSTEEELRRVIPVIKSLHKQVDIPLSIDTQKGLVMQAALDAGASMINDVSALTHIDDPTFLASNDVPIVLMHMRGRPDTMQNQPHYHNVCTEVYDFLAKRLAWCINQGISKHRLIIDPGIGFGKSHQHNMELLHHLRTFRGLGVPLLLGLSRKSLIGTLIGQSDPKQRDLASHVMATLGAIAGARILRVHDVFGAHQALAIAQGWSHGLEAAA